MTNFNRPCGAYNLYLLVWKLEKRCWTGSLINHMHLRTLTTLLPSLKGNWKAKIA